MSKSETFSMPPQLVETENSHSYITILDAILSSAPKVISVVADLLMATVDPFPPSSSAGGSVSPSKTCRRCLGTGRILRNAGTGLLGDCHVCRS
jgi:hypothetical protein